MTGRRPGGAAAGWPEGCAGAVPLRPADAEQWETLRQLVHAGMPPAQLADVVFKALREDQFYILPHPEIKESVRTRMEDILQERSPTTPGS